MIVMISARKPELESTVDERFGRCACLIKVDTETDQWEAFTNPGASQSGGAGVAAAQFVVDKKCAVVISGDFGPNAFHAFQAANVEMRLFGSGVTTVQQAVDAYRQGSLPLKQ